MADTAAAIPDGFQISPNILGNSSYIFPNSTQQFGIFDLTVPSADNIDLTSSGNPYNTLSVWCVVARADFASNNFAAVPEPTSGSALLLLAPLLLKRSARP